MSSTRFSIVSAGVLGVLAAGPWLGCGSGKPKQAPPLSAAATTGTGCETGGCDGSGGGGGSGGMGTGGGVVAPCSGETCLLTPPGMALAGLAGIAVDDQFVYWTDGGTKIGTGAIRKVPKGGGAVTTLNEAQALPYGLAVDQTSLYWTDPDASTVMTMPKGGGPPTRLASVPLLVQSGTHPFLLDGTDLYFSIRPNPAGSFQDGNVGRLPVAGGQPVDMLNLMSADQPNAIAVFGGDVYFCNGPIVKSISKTTAPGQKPKDLLTMQINPDAIAVDASGIYFADLGKGLVEKMAHDGTGLTTLATGQAGPWALVIDATNVYFTTEGTTSKGMLNVDGTVMKVPKDGSAPPTVIAGGQASPSALAVDAAEVYWVTLGTAKAIFRDGAVKKAPK